MKKTILTAAFTLAAIFGANTYAQTSNLQLGVKGGVNFANFTGDLDGNKVKVGFNVGMTVDFPLSQDLYLLSGLEFTTKGAKYSASTLGVKVEETDNANYLQLPIHIGYKLPVANETKLVLHAGPYLAYGIGGKATGSAGGVKGEADFFGDNGAKRFDAGLGIGAGLEFGKISVGLGVDYGLIDIDRSNDSSVKNINASLSVGYKF